MTPEPGPVHVTSASTPRRTIEDLDQTLDVTVGRWTVDFLWPERKVAVETDFFDYHRGSVAFEDDHQRELDLRSAGLTVRRCTGNQLDDHPAEIAAELGELLGGNRRS